MAFARTQHRLVVTKDTDFLRLSARGEEHYGIAFCPPVARTIGQILASLVRIYESLTPGEAKQRAIYL